MFTYTHLYKGMYSCLFTHLSSRKYTMHFTLAWCFDTGKVRAKCWYPEWDTSSCSLQRSYQHTLNCKLMR